MIIVLLKISNTVIQRAKEACKNSNVNVVDHFVEADKMVQIGSGAERKQKDYKLTRYACYLIAQNGDTRKKVLVRSVWEKRGSKG